MKWLISVACLALTLGLPSQLRASAAITVIVSPSSVQVGPGAQQQFTASVVGSSSQVVNWSVTGAGCSGITCGSINGSGVYTAPATAPSPNTVTVKATALADPSHPGSAAVTIQAAPKVAVTISPSFVALSVGGQQPFSATVTGTNNTAVTWSVGGIGCVGSSCGTISAAGLYTAPATVPNPALATVTATSVADPTKSAASSVIIQTTASISVTVSPNPAQVAAGGQLQFSASVTGASSTAVTWSVSGAGCGGASCGTITAGGLYTAPATAPNPPVVTVRAASQAAPSQSGTATVSIGAGQSITISPTAPQVKLSGQVQFSTTVNGTNSGVVLWSVSGSGCSGITCGSVSASGLYTAPAKAPNPPTVTVTATLLANPPLSASATVTLGSGAIIGVAISPTSQSMKTGGQQQFTATVTGSQNTAVTWTVSGVGCAGSTCGTVTSGGLYTAPSVVPNPSIVTVTATSQADSTKSASATVTLTALVTVAVSPKSATLAPGATKQFSATVSGSANGTVLWSVSGAACAGLSCGTISASGLYTAPPLVPNSPVTITATAQADSSKSDTATVTVLIPISVTVSPSTAFVTVGAQQPFGAKVAGTQNNAVTWTLVGAGCSGATCGTVNSSGIYTAPAAVPAPPTVTITATSVANPSASASAVITIQPTNNSKLTGQWAFLLKEFDLFGAYQAAGSINADGNGHFTGVEDVNRALGPLVNTPITGTYQVGGDNRGTITITNSQGSLTFALALGASGKEGRLVSFDNSGVRGSGILRRQDPSAFTPFAIANGYTLNLTGLDFSGQRVGAVASVFPNGFNGISGSGMDINDGGSTQNFTGFNGTYTVGGNGRGTFTLNGLGFQPLGFALYVVSANEIILVETDPLGPFTFMLAGVGEIQTGSPYLLSSFKGGSVFNLSGFNSGIGQASVGRMTFDGNGAVNVQADENSTGVITIGDLYTGTYTVAPNGRGLLTLRNNQSNKVTIWIFYAFGQNSAVLMDQGFVVNVGEMLNQLVQSPFDSGDFVGTFLFGSGEPAAIDSALVSGIGNFDGGTSVTGTQDQSQLGGQLPNQAVAGTYQISLVSNNGRGTILLTSPGPSTIALWLVSSSQAFAMDVDSGNAEPTLLQFEQ